DASPFGPDYTRPIAWLGGVLVGQDVSVDVTAALQAGPGVYTLAIRNDSTAGATYASREDLNQLERPELELVLQAPTTTTSPTSTTTTSTTSTAPTTSSSTTSTTATTSTTTTTVVQAAAMGTVEADVTVHERNPDTNAGADTILDASGQGTKHEQTYFRVSVSGVGTRRVASARLQLQV